MLHEGQQVELTIEKPASGGRMIARHLGQVVLVRGAIPGERVTAWIERAEKQVAYAVTRDVLEASPDRVGRAADPLCGGLLYAHIAYERQRALKADVIRDAFARIGRHPIESPVRRPGLPHRRLPDAGPTPRRRGTRRLLSRGNPSAVRRRRPPAAVGWPPRGRRIARTQPRSRGTRRVSSISISENIRGDQRAAHLELTGAAPGCRPRRWIATRGATAALTGVSAQGADS